ncbi:MAG: ATPase domain-containing protein [Sulfolobales archaeon]|nr:AAA family ATPase [Sulfolobales archaeon]MDW8083024.1 ATPase domain-containing protein [Sulfolobales archaeon]
MSTHSASSKLTTVTSGSEELDVRLGGGIPIPSLLVIEGDNGTGKTVLSCQLARGFLISNMRVMYVTTESTVKQFLEHAKNISIDLTQPFLKGYLSIVPALIENARWSKNRVKPLIERFVEYLKERSESYGVIIVDSASLLLHYVGDSDIHSLLSDVRNIVKKGTTFIMTLHPTIVSDRVVKELTAVSDVYFKLTIGEIGGRVVKVINVVKIRGAPTLAESSIAFDVDPAFGLKVVPLALAKA